MPKTKVYRCCIYQHNQTGRYSGQCIPREESEVCPERENHTVVIGFTSTNSNTCEGCREIPQILNDML